MAKLNIELIVGDSWPPGPDAWYVIQFNTGPEGGPYTPLDLTGATVVAGLTLNNETAVAVWTTELRDQVTEMGKCAVRLKASESAKLDWFTYEFSFAVAFDAESKITPLHGVLKMKDA